MCANLPLYQVVSLHLKVWKYKS